MAEKNAKDLLNALEELVEQLVNEAEARVEQMTRTDVTFKRLSQVLDRMENALDRHSP